MYIRLDENINHLQVSWGPSSRYTCRFDVNLPESTGKNSASTNGSIPHAVTLCLPLRKKH